MIINKITSLSRNSKLAILLASDTVILIVAILLSFTLRLGDLYLPPGFLENKITWLVFLSPLIGIPIFIHFGLYLEVIRFISSKTSWPIVKAVGLYSALWGLISLLSEAPGYPRSVILINFMVTIIGIAGSRVLAKYLLGRVESSNQKDGQEKIGIIKVLIYGAGSAGRQLAFGLNQSIDYELCGFIDDDESIQRRNLIGYPVISLREIEYFVQSKKVTDIFLAMPSITRKKRNGILKKLLPLKVRIKTLPGLS